MALLINHSEKWAFLHIPKTGGNSLSQILLTIEGTEYITTHNDLSAFGDIEDYFIFTFVRNPYDRIISGWNYCNKYNIPFDNYLNINFNANSYDYWHVFMPQSRHIINNNGKININFIGKFENIENDLIIVLNKLGFNNIVHIPFKKNSKKHDNYLTYYNKQIYEKVNKIINDDLILFDYELLI